MVNGSSDVVFDLLILSVTIRILVVVSILASVFKWIGNSKGVDTSYEKAWFIMFIPYLLVTCLGFVLLLFEFTGSQIFLVILSFALFIGILAVCMKFIFSEYDGSGTYTAFLVAYAIFTIVLYLLSYIFPY